MTKNSDTELTLKNKKDILRYDSDDDILEGFNYDTNTYENVPFHLPIDTYVLLNNQILSKDDTPLAVSLDIMLENGGQLGMGVKSLEGQSGVVIVSSFKYTDNGQCAAKKAGIRIGDQILVTGRYFIESVGSLQKAMKEILCPSSSSSSDKNREKEQVEEEEEEEEEIEEKKEKEKEKTGVADKNEDMMAEVDEAEAEVTEEKKANYQKEKKNERMIKSEKEEKRGVMKDEKKMKKISILLLRWPNPKETLIGFTATLKKDKEMSVCLSQQEEEEKRNVAYVHPLST